MRIGIFTETYPPFINGVSTSILMLQRALEKKGHTVFIITVGDDKRKYTLEEYSKIINVETIFEDEYGLDAFCKNVIDDLDNRCVNYCYPVRLRKTFEYAKENGYDAVTTTLLYSIYQKHDAIKKICEDLSKEYGIEFIYRDFREGFRYGQDKAREIGIYMQKYCGCIFSEEDRYKEKIEKDKKKYGVIKE